MLSVSSQNSTIYFNTVNMTLACIADKIICKVAKFWQQRFSLWQTTHGKAVRRMCLQHSNCSQLCHQNLGDSYSLYTDYLDIHMCFYCLHLNYIQEKMKPYSSSNSIILFHIKKRLIKCLTCIFLFIIFVFHGHLF